LADIWLAIKGKVLEFEITIEVFIEFVSDLRVFVCGIVATFLANKTIFTTFCSANPFYGFIMMRAGWGLVGIHGRGGCLWSVDVVVCFFGGF